MGKENWVTLWVESLKPIQCAAVMASTTESIISHMDILHTGNVNACKCQQELPPPPAPISNTSALKPINPHTPLSFIRWCWWICHRSLWQWKAAFTPWHHVLRSCPPWHGDQENSFVKELLACHWSPYWDWVLEPWRCVTLHLDIPNIK